MLRAMGKDHTRGKAGDASGSERGAGTGGVDGTRGARLGDDAAGRQGPFGQLEALLAEVRRRGLRRAAGVEDLPGLYRTCHTDLARRRAAGKPGATLSGDVALLARAHGLLHRPRPLDGRHPLGRLADYFLVTCPRAVRAEWRLLALAFVLVYGIAAAGFAAVATDLDRAYDLFDPAVVDNEIQQLEALEEGEDFQGNFTFGLGESPKAAGWILAHNMGVGILFFGAGLLPPLFVLLVMTNGLMLGVYTAVAWHYGQAAEISSVLWCHGVIEIQCFVLAACAGMVMLRAFLAPGPWSRMHALALSSRRAWALFAPTFPLLFCAGLIEGFVSPHAPLAVRLTVAIGTGLGLVAWGALSGRGVALPDDELAPA